MVLRFSTQGFSGYNLQYSPFFDNRVAVASGSNFGIVGNGKLFILDIDRQGTIHEANSFLTQDCLFDLCWNEVHENQVLVAQGDGSLRLFDTKLSQYPIAIFNGHEREVISCNWNLVGKQTFISSSWDGTVKVWSPTRKENLLTLHPVSFDHSISTNVSVNNLNSNPKSRGAISTNKDCVYQGQFSPHDDNIIMCSSGNSYVTLFDVRQPNYPSNHRRILAHSGLEALTCDFNKYRPNIIASSGVDNTIRIWDIRMLANSNSIGSGTKNSAICINEINNAHDLAVRRVSWSPHHPDMLLSVSYDMTCRIWKDFSFDESRQTMKTNSIDPGKGCIKNFQGHSEFVFGADWSLWGQPGFIATTGWDGNVFIWNAFQN